MCNTYTPARPDVLAKLYGVPPPAEAYKTGLGPWDRGPLIRPTRNSAIEAVVGQWALIGDNAREAKSPVRIMTNNARWEELTEKRTYKGPWARGQRCLIPAEAYDEPCYVTGSNVWWRFKRADGTPWALAGLWNEWTDPLSGEVVVSYTMLTLNCDGHPLLSLMHKPDPKRPPDKQDKRAIVPLEPADWETWLYGTADEADSLRGLPSPERYDAQPVAGVPKQARREDGQSELLL